MRLHAGLLCWLTSEKRNTRRILQASTTCHSRVYTTVRLVTSKSSHPSCTVLSRRPAEARRTSEPNNQTQLGTRHFIFTRVLLSRCFASFTCSIRRQSTQDVAQQLPEQ